jgi:hypothetical protein
MPLTVEVRTTRTTDSPSSASISRVDDPTLPLSTSSTAVSTFSKV